MRNHIFPTSLSVANIAGVPTSHIHHFSTPTTSVINLVPSKSFFFCNIGSFHPLCVRSPLDTLESGVLFHILVVETVTCFTRRSTMESSVVSSLPDCTFNPAERKCGGNDQLWNTPATMGGRPSCESYCWLFTISSPTFGRIKLDTDGMRCLPWTNLFLGCRPA